MTTQQRDGVAGAIAPFDEARLREAIAAVIEAIGEDPAREGLAGTPRRVAALYGEIFSGLRADPRAELSTGFEEGHKEMVILKDVPFFSTCEHHFMPFHGKAHVGYIPDGRVVGISKIARVIEAFARRPQLQERLTGQIADCIMECLQPDGVAVVIEAEHLCMTMRGVKKPGSTVVTSAMRGQFRRSAVTRSEFLSLVRGSA